MTATFLTCVVGLALGYLFATVAESLQHRWFGHAPRQIRRLWRNHPGLFGWLRWVWWSHTVVHHHAGSGRWFCSPEARHMGLLDRMTPVERRVAVSNRFGLSITLNSFAWFMWLPMTALPLVWALLGWWGAAAALLPMSIPPLLSRMVHPHIHRPYESAVTDSGIAVRWLLTSKYGRAMIRHHWLHHRYPGANFNLLLGGDWLLLVGRTATARDTQEMTMQGIRLD